MGATNTGNLVTVMSRGLRGLKRTVRAALVGAALLAVALTASSGSVTAQGGNVSVTTEPVGGDLIDYEATQGVLRVGTDSTGHLTRGQDGPNSPGDWWRLEWDRTKDYLVEVAFGSTVTADKGGGLEVYFTGWDGARSGWGQHWDHNRDDGAAFLFLPGDIRSHWLRVDSQDFLSSGNLTYYGDYTITLTDITDVATQVSNLDLQSPSTKATIGYSGGAKYLGASSVTTGSNTGGYRLEWVQTTLEEESSVANRPQVSLHTNSSGNPGTKVFDFVAPAAINDHPSPRGWDHALAPNTSAATLAASTKYWIVFEETLAGSQGAYKVPLSTSTSATTDAESGWSISAFKVYDSADTSPSWADGSTQTPFTFSVHAVNIGGA